MYRFAKWYDKLDNRLYVNKTRTFIRRDKWALGGVFAFSLTEMLRPGILFSSAEVFGEYDVFLGVSLFGMYFALHYAGDANA